MAGLHALERLVRRRQPHVVDHERWLAIDRAEVERGQADGRPRDKFATVEEMLDVPVPVPRGPLSALRFRAQR